MNDFYVLFDFHTWSVYPMIIIINSSCIEVESFLIDKGLSWIYPPHIPLCWLSCVYRIFKLFKILIYTKRLAGASIAAYNIHVHSIVHIDTYTV